MFSEEDTFTRELDIDVLDKTLVFKQKIVGDVNCVVWDAALVLAKYYEEIYKNNNDAFKNSKVLELGAGLGCVGLTLASLGAEVVLTDLPETLPLLNLNIKENKSVIEYNNGSAISKPFLWGSDDSNLDFVPNLVTFADCVYYKESINPLLSTLRTISGPNTEIIISHELRDTPIQQNNWKYFLGALKKDFLVDYVPLCEQNQVYSSPDIKLIKLKKRICEI